MRRLVILAVCLACLAPPAAPQSGASASSAVLQGRYQKWLDEEVVYIISKRERDVFRVLQTDRERDIFIEAFWKHRDPTPGTPRNEFEEEHRRRLDHATRFYGRSTPLPGWMTDRGRMYIILGPPRNIEQYDTVNGVYPTEIWFYLGDPDQGLPTAFNLIFFKRDGGGDYILYSPTEHGPRSLIASSMGGYRDASRSASSMSNDQAAYKELQELEPNLARQTLSLIPGEASQPGNESLASNRLIATIATLPQKNVDAGYADAILKYKDFIEVDYTANYIASDALVQVLRDDSGQSYVHYTIEPSRISADEVRGKFEVIFRLTGRVSDAAGRTVYQYDKSFPFSLTSGQLEDVRAQSISIQDSFPLVPGSYTFDVILKNALSKEFTGAAATVVVPGPDSSPGLGPLLLAYGAEPGPAGAAERVPFKVGEAQILCQSRKTFSSRDSVVLVCQPHGITEALRASGTLLTTLLREDMEVRRKETRLADVPVAGLVDIQPLQGLTPGYYQALAVLLDGSGKELARVRENFEISLAAAVPRPLIMAKVGPAPGGEDDLLATGVQFMNKGDFVAARPRLAEAFRRAPERQDLAVAYAQALFRLTDYQGVQKALGPWAGADNAAAETLALLGQAGHALGEFAEASKHYGAYLVRYGANVDILNYLGTCYNQLGNTDEALKAWTKSLELNPNQEKLRALVDSLKKK